MSEVSPSDSSSRNDISTVDLDDASDIPREAVIAAACILDALENK